jgi:hypothetical protein
LGSGVYIVRLGSGGSGVTGDRRNVLAASEEQSSDEGHCELGVTDSSLSHSSSCSFRGSRNLALSDLLRLLSSVLKLVRMD